MNLEWHPLIPAALTGAVAVGFYIYGWLPRVTAFFTAAALVFLAAGTGVLVLAHHSVADGPWQVAIVLGAALSLVLFFFVVIKGHHKHPVIKGLRRSAAGSAAPGAAGAGSKGHPKAPHHRAMTVTVLAVAFSFLLAVNFSSIWHAGSGGVSQTGSGITQGGN